MAVVLLTKEYIYIRKILNKGCELELKCPNGMEEVCEALALLTCFFFLCIKKKTNVSVGFSLPLMLVNLFHI